jgi:hypothetical protein
MTDVSPLPYIHTFPECDVAFDGSRCIRGLGVIPRCIFISIAIDDKRIVICKALPWTAARRHAGPKILRIDGLRREVVVASTTTVLSESAITVPFHVAAVISRSLPDYGFEPIQSGLEPLD